MDERTFDIPEMRGMSPDKRAGGEVPCSPESYAAQYGVTVQDAEDLAGRRKDGKAVKSGLYSTHGDVKRELQRRFRENEDVRRRVLMLDEDSPASPGEGAPLSFAGEEERERIERLIERTGLTAVEERER